jgi:diadenosine tetraphosphate (Ap4A) HIT family hydrolase
VGPLGVGTLVVKPERHVLRVADLTEAEAAELGPLLAQTAGVITRLRSPAQVYVCLWSHAKGVPGHIHFVVQPVAEPRRKVPGSYGPALQVAMFARNRRLKAAEVENFAAQARQEFAAA